MPALFLSYAEEDTVLADKVSERLKQGLGEQWEIYNWQEPQQRGYKWIQKIEEQIAAAVAFLALVSPHYLTSPWCNHERDMALRRDAATPASNQFLWVGEVASTKKLGVLANYDWLDLTGANWSSNLDILIERLTLKMGIRIEEPSPVLVSKDWRIFQNRKQEIQELVNNLTNMAGEHFWQILSAPQMGKTSLLQRLAIELTERDSSWRIVQMDLRNQPIDARINLRLLLSLLFNQELNTSINNREITQIVRQIVGQNCPWLIILDSAELLDDNITKRFRECLSQIQHQIAEGGRDKARLAFIAASRRPISKWRGVLPPPRFAEISLSHFDYRVIKQFLHEMAQSDNRKKDDHWFQDVSTNLYQASEGLPGLLVKYMDWIHDSEYVFRPNDIKGINLFNSFAKPYIIQHLLSAHSLFPSTGGTELIEPQRLLLERALLKLSIFRRFTEKYLYQFIEESDELRELLRKAGLQKDQIWEMVKKSYVMQTAPNIWTIPYSSIRKLLFRYQHPSSRNRASAHKKAIEFYQGTLEEWTGTDKVLVLLEYLWHQAEYFRISKKKAESHIFLNSAIETINQNISSNHQIGTDMANMFEVHFLEDLELQETLEAIGSGFSSRIIENIQ